MMNPIEKAKAMTPWWMMEIRRFDGLEIHPVRDLKADDPGDETWCEPCEPEEAQFWSVYGHLVEGGVECFEDFPTEAEARAFAEKLLEAYPHLRTFGLMG